MLHQKLHKHHKKILLVNLIIFIGSLVLMTTTPMYNKDMITGLVGNELDEQNIIEINNSRNIISIIGGVGFILNIIFVIVLMMVVRSGSYMVGSTETKASYSSNQKILTVFMNSICQTYIKFSEPHYTAYIFDSIKKKHQDKTFALSYIKLDILNQTNKIDVQINKKIDSVNEFQLLKTIQLLVDELSDADNSGSFRTLLKYNIEPELLTLLEQKGIYI